MPLIKEMNVYKGLSEEEILFIKSGTNFEKAWKKKDWPSFENYKLAMQMWEKKRKERALTVKNLVKNILKWGIILSPFIVIRSVVVVDNQSIGETMGAVVLSLLPALLIWSIINFLKKVK